MRRLAILLLLTGTPALAQDADEDPGPMEGQIEQFFRDLFDEVEPRLRELRDAIGTLDDYEAPEMLPNGDIIIRRKTPQDSAPEPEEKPEAEAGDPIDI